MSSDKTQTLVEIALSIALAVALNALKLGQMPQGGSISLVMLPIIVVAIRRGPAAGMVAGALYGGLDVMLDPSYVHPAQLLLDYPLAFGAVGLAGLFAPYWNEAVRKAKTTTAVWAIILPAIAVGALGRYVMHVISGVVFFGEYAPKGTPVLVYSTLYNSFVWVSAAVCFAAAAVVLPALARAGIGTQPGKEATVS